MTEHGKSLLVIYSSPPLWRRAASLSAGLLVSFFILWGISVAQSTKVNEESVEIEELRTFVYPPPPAPPVKKSQDTPPPPNPVHFELSPSESPVTIAATPITFTANVERTRFTPNLSMELAAFKPDLELDKNNVDRIYNHVDVDQIPQVIYKKVPDLSRDLLKRINVPKVTLLYIVNKEGRASNIQVLDSPDPEFDRGIIEALKKWKFKPALKDGKVVTCLIQQRINVKFKRSNRFEN